MIKLNNTEIQKIIFNGKYIQKVEWFSKDSSTGTTVHTAAGYIMYNNEIVELLALEDVGTDCSKIRSILSRLQNYDTIYLPVGVTSITEGCFNIDTKIKNIVLPMTLESIDQYAFNGCTNLTTVSGYPVIQRLGQGCFSGCRKLVNIPTMSRLIEIKQEAFSDCWNLDGSSAFIRAMNLIQIESLAFYNCGSVIALPSTVRNVDKLACHLTAKMSFVTPASGGVPTPFLPKETPDSINFPYGAISVKLLPSYTVLSAKMLSASTNLLTINTYMKSYVGTTSAPIPDLPAISSPDVGRDILPDRIFYVQSTMQIASNIYLLKGFYKIKKGYYYGGGAYIPIFPYANSNTAIEPTYNVPDYCEYSYDGYFTY